MVFCIYYYHELVKERANKSPRRQMCFQIGEPRILTYLQPTSSTPEGGFWCFFTFLRIKSTANLVHL